VTRKIDDHYEFEPVARSRDTARRRATCRRPRETTGGVR
jgi:hypothetical protein